MTIQHKRIIDGGRAPTPAQIEEGELCINLTDQTIYTKNNNNNIISIGGGGGGDAGNILGSFQAYPSTMTDVPEGHLWAEGQLVQRTEFPDLWTWADDNGLVVTETEWQDLLAASPNGTVNVYSEGTGGADFRIPLVHDFLRGLEGGGGDTSRNGIGWSTAPHQHTATAVFTGTAHNHTQNAHNHTQNAHTHVERMDGRDTNQNSEGPYVAGSNFTQTTGIKNGITTGATTATNIATTATNNAATAGGTVVVTVDPGTGQTETRPSNTFVRYAIVAKHMTAQEQLKKADTTLVGRGSIIDTGTITDTPNVGCHLSWQVWEDGTIEYTGQALPVFGDNTTTMPLPVPVNPTFATVTSSTGVAGAFANVGFGDGTAITTVNTWHDNTPAPNIYSEIYILQHGTGDIVKGTAPTDGTFELDLEAESLTIPIADQTAWPNGEVILSRKAGVVHAYIVSEPVTAPAADQTVIATLPEGWRPNTAIEALNRTAGPTGNMSRFYIGVNGDIVCFGFVGIDSSATRANGAWVTPDPVTATGVAIDGGNTLLHDGWSGQGEVITLSQGMSNFDAIEIQGLVINQDSGITHRSSVVVSTDTVSEGNQILVADKTGTADINAPYYNINVTVTDDTTLTVAASNDSVVWSSAGVRYVKGLNYNISVPVVKSTITGRGSIVESGTDGRWKYEKWEDGTTHQSGTFFNQGGENVEDLYYSAINNYAMVISTSLTNAYGTPTSVDEYVVHGQLGPTGDAVRWALLVQQGANGVGGNEAGVKALNSDALGVTFDIWEYGTGDVETSISGVPIDGTKTMLWAGDVEGNGVITLSESFRNFDAIYFQGYVANVNLPNGKRLFNTILPETVELANVGRRYSIDAYTNELDQGYLLDVEFDSETEITVRTATDGAVYTDSFIDRVWGINYQVRGDSGGGETPPADNTRGVFGGFNYTMVDGVLNMWVS